jgi:hypothetical protein
MLYFAPYAEYVPDNSCKGGGSTIAVVSLVIEIKETNSAFINASVSSANRKTSHDLFHEPCLQF